MIVKYDANSLWKIIIFYLYSCSYILVHLGRESGLQKIWVRDSFLFSFGGYVLCCGSYSQADASFDVIVEGVAGLLSTKVVLFF